MRSRPFYTSKYLIQDTAKSIGVHMATGFSGKPHAAYIEFWGVMQALVIQQDAIVELHKSICEMAPVLAKASPWFDIRDLRQQVRRTPGEQRAQLEGHHAAHLVCSPGRSETKVPMTKQTHPSRLARAMRNPHLCMTSKYIASTSASSAVGSIARHACCNCSSPLWVKLGRNSTSAQSPLFPQ